MKIQIASDLHIEQYLLKDSLEQNPLIPKGSVLVLAGDICCYSKRQYLNYFLDLWKQQFKKIIYIPGNHEYYGGHFNINTHNFIKEEDNLVELNNYTYEFEGVRFVCSTLWSGVSEETTNMISDYSVIRGFSKRIENEAHLQSVNFLKRTLSVPFDGKTIVVTHHLPLADCIDAAYKGSGINDAFYSNQEQLFDYKIDYWIHGHSHNFQQFKFKNTIVLRNPRGYYSEYLHGGFSNDYTIEV
jgi:predicted phosphodiesterase